MNRCSVYSLLGDSVYRYSCANCKSTHTYTHFAERRRGGRVSADFDFFAHSTPKRACAHCCTLSAFPLSLSLSLYPYKPYKSDIGILSVCILPI